VQRRLLPEIVALDLLTSPPRVVVPVHYVFGAEDALASTAVVAQLQTRVAAAGSTVTVIQNAGHMVHFDRPARVRSIVVSGTRSPQHG
jgi:pimeloyl-ACP methyl ester carboxylesterase